MMLSVSGSAGTGKTTLVTELAARFDCPVVDGRYENVFSDDHEFIKPAIRL